MEEEEVLVIGKGENARPLVPIDTIPKIPLPIRQYALGKIFDKMIELGVPRQEALKQSVQHETTFQNRVTSKEIYRCSLPGVLRSLEAEFKAAGLASKQESGRH